MTRQLEFTPAIQEALNSERYHQPLPVVQRRMEAVWVKSHGLPHGQIAQVVNITENTLRDYFQLYLEGGVARLKEGAIPGPESALQEHYASLEAYFRAHPPATIKEAQSKIEALTGIKRSETQVREFLKKNSVSAAVGSVCSRPKLTPTRKRATGWTSWTHAEPRPVRGSAPSSLSMPRTLW
jgi:transposase